MKTFAEKIADTSAARGAIRTILAYARQADKPVLTQAVRDSYSRLFSESGLRAGSVEGNSVVGSGQTICVLATA
ncbi:hypothetical protein ACOCG7_34050 (plasmid) [Paraburkholderia sp. DD10]|uniref:hypothetical protein n=1 Tax=Paraburkholderia sp. DD10 TaxID=3409691 RepID=UPI003BA0F1E1